MLRDLSGRKHIPAQVRALVHFDKSSCVPETDEDIKFKSSIKARTRGKLTLLELTKRVTFDVRVNSMITLIPARNKMMEMVHPVNIPLKCWCQLPGADFEKDLE